MEKRLVDYLVKNGVVSQGAVQRCILRASMNKSGVVDELASAEEVDQAELARGMAEYWGLEYWSEPQIPAQAPALNLLSFEDSLATGVLPVEASPEEGVITLAVYDVEKAKPAIEKLRRMKGVAPTLLVAGRDQVLAEIDRNYRELVEQEIRRRYRLDEEEQEAPTRQVDLTRDNPFLDLIEESGRGAKQGASERSGEEEEDFFSEFSSQPEAEGPAPVVSDRRMIRAALEAFEDSLVTRELDGAEVESEPEDVGDWESVGSGSGALYDSQGPVRARSGAGEFARGFEVSGSALFSVDSISEEIRDLEWGSEEMLGELLKLVEEQRRAILKLERQIAHQKGILQTFAEMLIEDGVFDRDRVKARLKALKVEQKRRR